MAVIGLCLLVSRPAPRLMAVLFGAGAMTLTLYSLHIWMLTPEVRPPEPPNEAAVYVRHVSVVLGVGAAFALARWRGPLEYVVGVFDGHCSGAASALGQPTTGSWPMTHLQDFGRAIDQHTARDTSTAASRGRRTRRPALEAWRTSGARSGRSRTLTGSTAARRDEIFLG